MRFEARAPRPPRSARSRGGAAASAPSLEHRDRARARGRARPVEARGGARDSSGAARAERRRGGAGTARAPRRGRALALRAVVARRSVRPRAPACSASRAPSSCCGDKGERDGQAPSADQLAGTALIRGAAAASRAAPPVLAAALRAGLSVAAAGAPVLPIISSSLTSRAAIAGLRVAAARDVPLAHWRQCGERGQRAMCSASARGGGAGSRSASRRSGAPRGRPPVGGARPAAAAPPGAKGITINDSLFCRQRADAGAGRAPTGGRGRGGGTRRRLEAVPRPRRRSPRGA